jgi:hypothetical protein
MADLKPQLNINLYNDALARKVIRYLLFFQLGALVLGLIFSLTTLTTLALFIAFLTLVAMLGTLFWTYIRYKSYPIVQEKMTLLKKANEVQNQIKVNTDYIQQAKQKREDLKRAEQTEMQATLLATQNEYIRGGMNAARITDASISGIGPALKQRLIEHGYKTAASITSQITTVEGFGPAKSQAVIDWHNKINAGLNSSKPVVLAPEQMKIIRDKFEALHTINTTAQNKYMGNKVALEETLGKMQPRIQELAPIKFGTYLRKALATGGLAAGLVGGVLIITQICLGTSSTLGAIMAAIPTITQTPSATLTPTFTFSPTITFTPTITDTPTLTFTSTITDTPTITFTPSKTYTPTRTSTPTGIPTQTLFPTSLVTLPIGGSTLIPTQPSQGSCCKVCGSTSKACGDSCISLKYTCHKAPGCACQ